MAFEERRLAEGRPSLASMLPKAIFLDRDGTLIVNRHYLADPARVELLPGVREALHGFLADGCRLFLFTNQSGIGRGMFSLETVLHCNRRMFELLALPAPGFTETCIAPETPGMPVVYRKPSPRFILEMSAKFSLPPTGTWMVGDKMDDVQAGLNAGVRAALIQPGDAAALPDGVWQCRDLVDFRSRFQTHTA